MQTEQCWLNSKPKAGNVICLFSLLLPPFCEAQGASLLKLCMQCSGKKVETTVRVPLGSHILRTRLSPVIQVFEVPPFGFPPVEMTSSAAPPPRLGIALRLSCGDAERR